MKPIKIYCSHTIRGKEGVNATDEQMEANCREAVKTAETIRAYLLDWERMNGMCHVDLYVPGEHDEFIQIAYREGMLTETQILDVDCKILDKCELMLMFGDYISRGMKREMDFALENMIPVFKFSKFTPGVARELYETLKVITGV